MKSVVLILALCGVAHADPPARPLRQAILMRFDRNHDGRLDARERHQAARALRRLARRLEHPRNPRLGAIIQRYDLDGDGNVGPGEMPPDLAARLRRLDRNGDGWLDERDFR
jgi:hypothetical protein